MKALSLVVAGLAVAILSVAPASAEKNGKIEVTYRCSSTTWPNISATPCNKPAAHNYAECLKMVTDMGWRPSDAWWGCSNQGFKN